MNILIVLIIIVIILYILYNIVFSNNNTNEYFKETDRVLKYRDIIKKEIKDKQFQKDNYLKEMKIKNKKHRLFLKSLTSKIVETKNIKSRNKLIDRLKLKLKKKN